MLIKTKTIFDDCNYNTFTSQACEVLKSASEKFWEKDFIVKLQAMNDFREIRCEKLIANVDFFSSQIKVEGHKPIIVRLSKDFVEYTLRTILKANSRFFVFTKLTPLEIKILNSYCEFLYKRLNDILIPQKEAKLTERSEKNINFIFFVAYMGGECSKVMISIPQDRIKTEKFNSVKSFKDEDFKTSRATVRVKAGSSMITLDELQNLSKDDIVVLENSELTKLTLISGDVEEKFNVEVDPSLVLDIPKGEDDYTQSYDEVKMNKNLWDDIQIEVNAEFEKVKMTIGELKQITQGQIVDLGSVFDNEISLFVEDRKVARGELIIINDRYAIRLNEVLSSDTKSLELSKPIENKAKPQVKAQPKVEPKVETKSKVEKVENIDDDSDSEDEEFDYSDFEK